MGKTIEEMTAEVREVNTKLGWRTGTNTLGDYVALIHSEVVEALEAYRDHRLADATGENIPVYSDEEDVFGNYQIIDKRPAKPEGVGSELADVLIRILDTCDVPAFERDAELADVPPLALEQVAAPHRLVTFGDWMAWLHRRIDRFWDNRNGPALLRALVTAAERFDVDLTAEYERKISYNRTRPYRHGGRTLTDAEARS